MESIQFSFNPLGGVPGTNWKNVFVILFVSGIVITVGAILINKHIENKKRKEELNLKQPLK